MKRYIVLRLLWMLPTLLGITLVTFLLMDLAPSDRAELNLPFDAALDAKDRSKQFNRLQEHYGLIDRETKEPYSVWYRYGRWLSNAVGFQLAGPGESAEDFRSRIGAAAPVTLLVNLLALGAALAIALPLGARLGMAMGSATDRIVSGAMFVAYGVPEFLMATLLVLGFGGAWLFDWFPVVGLRSPGSGEWPAWQQLLDLAYHLVLPVGTLAIGPCVVITRFLRESVGRVVRSDYVLNMRAWGLPESVVRRRALRNGLSPVVTLLGTLLPLLVSGSVVVENVFTLPGMGSLAYGAVMTRDQGMVMALTLLVSTVTLSGLLLSDVLHRVVDPRVRLS